MKKKPRRDDTCFYTQDVRSGEENDIKMMFPDFETIKDKKNETRIRQKVLFSSNNTEEQQLGIKLNECGKTPCCSTACPVCAMQYKCWTFGETNHLYEQYPNTFMMTVVNYKWMIPDENLEQFNPFSHMDRFRKQLERCGITFPIVGSLEIDYHTENKMWLPHFHLIIPSKEPEAIKKLRKMLKRQNSKVEGRTQKSIRPIRVDRLKNRPAQISYIFKSYWKCIDAYISCDGKRRTAKYRLDNKRLRRSLCFQDKFKFSDFLFLYKVRRYGSRLRVTSVRENKANNPK